MKNLKIIGLIFFLMIGIGTPSCDKEDADCCGGSGMNSCDGVVFQNYFDIEGIGILAYTDFIQRTEIPPLATVTFDELDKVYIDYQVEYTTSVQSKNDWSFSLIPTANACSYVPGTKGSKEQGIVDFSIITLNDFDAEHLANTSINDLFDYFGSNWQPLENSISLAQFLENQTGLIQEEGMFLNLKKAPELEEEFKVKVVMKLSTGEVFEVESEPIFIK